MTISSIKHKDFWRSSNALYRRYLDGSVPLRTPCVSMGEGSLNECVWLRHSVLWIIRFDYDIKYFDSVIWLLILWLPTMIVDWIITWNKTNLSTFFNYFGNLRMGELFPHHQKWLPWGTKGHFLDGGNNSPIIHPSPPPYLGWYYISWSVLFVGSLEVLPIAGSKGGVARAVRVCVRTCH